MPKYTVTIQEVLAFELNVEAMNPERAKEIALHDFLNTGKSFCPDSVLEREVTNVQEIR